VALLLRCVLALAVLGGPELPTALQSDPRAVAAWAVICSEADALARREAARELLERLTIVPAEERYAFLLACEGEELLLADTGAAWCILAAEWPEARVRIASLVRDEHRVDAADLSGALRAAGWLGLAEPALVEAVAARLHAPRTVAAARFALTRITGREFAQAEDFRAWWLDARLLRREDWLAAALEEERARALQRWEELLARDPAWGLAAARDPAAAVRRLGYAALRRMEPPAGLPADSAPAAVLREALARESEPELREQLIPLVPRFLAGEDAIAALDTALASTREPERLCALAQLPALGAPQAAWERIWREMWRAYPLDGRPPLAGTEFRMSLWNALHQILAQDAAFAPSLAAHETGLLLALLESLESESAVRGRIYAVAGRLGQDPLQRALLRHAAASARPLADRTAALEAAASLVLRAGRPADLRAILPALLADPAAEVRASAVRSCARLGDLQDLELLAARLGSETEPALVGDLLKALRERASPAILASLLAAAPPLEQEAEFGRALQAQIREDFTILERVVATLLARGRADSAYALAYGFRRESLSAEALEAHDRMLARTQTAWLTRGGIGTANAARAQDALAFLGDLERRWPQQEEWPRLQAELAQEMGRTDAALAALERWLVYPGVERAAMWPVGLRVARSAATLGIFERGWNLLESLGPPPAALAEEAAQVRALFPARAVPPPSPAGG